MKIATKNAIGLGLLLLLLAASLIYHLSQVNRLSEMNCNLSSSLLHASRGSLRLSRQLDLVEEYARKYSVSGDTGYLIKFVEAREIIAIELRQMSRLRLNHKGRQATVQLMKEWDAFQKRFNPALLVKGVPLNKHQSVFREQVSLLRKHLHTIITSTQTAIITQAITSARIRRRTKRLSWIVMIGVSALAIIVLLVTHYSINRPLKRLINGTQVVSRGNFNIQIDQSHGDEFSRVAQSFNTMVRRLGELDQMKRDFVSHVSHELKTPITSIQEANRLLMDGLPGPLTDKQRRLLRLNLESGQRLSSMITKLLDVSRLEASVNYHIQSHDLLVLVRKAVSENEMSMRQKRVYVTTDMPDPPFVVHCDADWITRVIANLLENAIRHSPPEGEVRLRVGCADRKLMPVSRQDKVALVPSEYAMVVVTDSGPGISDGDKARVFEKFFQVVEGASHVSGGVGLGLAICSAVVEAHQGAIWVTDSPGSGASFHVILPRTVSNCG